MKKEQIEEPENIPKLTAEQIREESTKHIMQQNTNQIVPNTKYNERDRRHQNGME